MWNNEMFISAPAGLWLDADITNTCLVYGAVVGIWRRVDLFAFAKPQHEFTVRVLHFIYM